MSLDSTASLLVADQCCTLLACRAYAINNTDGSAEYPDDGTTNTTALSNFYILSNVTEPGACTLSLIACQWPLLCGVSAMYLEASFALFQAWTSCRVAGIGQFLLGCSHLQNVEQLGSV